MAVGDEPVHGKHGQDEREEGRDPHDGEERGTELCVEVLVLEGVARERGDCGLEHGCGDGEHGGQDDEREDRLAVRLGPEPRDRVEQERDPGEDEREQEEHKGEPRQVEVRALVVQEAARHAVLGRPDLRGLQRQRGRGARAAREAVGPAERVARGRVVRTHSPVREARHLRRARDPARVGLDPVEAADGVVVDRARNQNEYQEQHVAREEQPAQGVQRHVESRFLHQSCDLRAQSGFCTVS